MHHPQRIVRMLTVVAAVLTLGVASRGSAQCNAVHPFDSFHLIVPAVSAPLHPAVGFPTHLTLTFLNPLGSINPATVSVVTECHKAAPTDAPPCVDFDPPVDLDFCSPAPFILNNNFQERTVEITLCPATMNTWVRATYVFATPQATAVQAEATFIWDPPAFVTPGLSQDHIQLVRDACR